MATAMSPLARAFYDLGQPAPGTIGAPRSPNEPMCGRKGEIERTYVLEKLATSDTTYPQGMLDPFRLRLLIRALEADPRSPIAWMAEQSGMGDWTGRKRKV